MMNTVEGSFRQNAERFLSNPIVWTILFFVGLLITVQFPERQMAVTAIVGLAIALSVGVLVYGAYRAWFSRSALEAKYKELEDKFRSLEKRAELAERMPRFLWHKSINIQVSLTPEGHGDYRYRYEGQYLGTGILESIKHEVRWDGEKLDPSTIAAFVDNDECDVDLEAYQIIREDKPVLQGATIILRPSNGIIPKKDVVYKYCYRLPGAFKEAVRGGEDYVSYTIISITDNFTLEVFAPEKYVFTPHYKPYVRNPTGMDDLNELARVSEPPNRPILNAKRSAISWSIKNPKVSYTYGLTFRLRQCASEP
jgi:hypothetical protein